MTIRSLVQHFESVGDPRCRGKILHRLEEILVIAVCAVIACAAALVFYGVAQRCHLRTVFDTKLERLVQKRHFCTIVALVE